MSLPSIRAMLNGIPPEEALTYAPSFGIMPLRECWKEALFEKNPSLAGKGISLPVVTHAITHGLSVLSDLWVDPGDVILLPDKMWGNYNLIFAVRRGAQIVTYPLFDEEGGFHLGAFTEAVREHPTGYTISPLEGDKIVECLAGVANEGTNVLAITDDAYFGLFYEETCLKESLFARLAEKEPRLLAIKVDGATKENFVWGLRVGFITYGAQLPENGPRVYEALEQRLPPGTGNGAPVHALGNLRN
jgi:aspartate/methionine/tyrosine aminotransferase